MPETGKSEVETDYIFEPNRNEILDNLIPKSIKTQVFKAS
jgi:F-type H+-transporting ATPase subunit gamma